MQALTYTLIFISTPTKNFTLLPVLLQKYRKTHLIEPPNFTWISESYIHLSIFEIVTLSLIRAFKPFINVLTVFIHMCIF